MNATFEANSAHLYIKRVISVPVVVVTGQCRNSLTD
jgi:hypothetical protein